MRLQFWRADDDDDDDDHWDSSGWRTEMKHWLVLNQTVIWSHLKCFHSHHSMWKKTSIFHILCSMLNHSVSDPGFLCLFNRKQTLCIPASCRLSASIHRRQTTQPHYSTRPWDGFPSSVQTAASHSNVSEYGSHKSDIYKWNHIFWGFRQTDKTRRLI